MVFQLFSVALAPAQGIGAGFYQAPAFLVAGKHVAMKVGVDFVAVRGEGNLRFAFAQPQGQGVRGLEPVLLSRAQLQAGTEHLQAL